MPLMLLQVLGEFLGGAVGLVDEEAAGDAAIVLDGLEDLLLALFAHARKGLQLAFFRQLLDAGQVADLEGAPDQRDRLRSEALDLEQLQHGRVILLQQLLMQLQLAGLSQLLDVGGHALADAGNLEQLSSDRRRDRTPVAAALRWFRRRDGRNECGTNRRR